MRAVHHQVNAFITESDSDVDLLHGYRMAVTPVLAEKSKHDDNLESLYPGYKLIKDAIERDPKLVYKLKQTFNPSVNLFNIHLKCMCFISLFLNPHKQYSTTGTNY